MDLGLPDEALRASETAYASIQRHVAIFFPDRAQELRRNFEEAGLPVVGFDEELPLSPERRRVRALTTKVRELLRSVQTKARKEPQSIDVRSLTERELLGLQVDGDLLFERGHTVLAEKWARCSLHRRPSSGADTHEVAVDALTTELEERVAVLSALDAELLQQQSTDSVGEFFHVMAQGDDGDAAIANDLTRGQLMDRIVAPLRSGKAIRIDGRLVDPDHPHLKVTKTDRDASHFRRELELQRKRTGHVDFSVNVRALPIAGGIDVTSDFFEPVLVKRAGDSMAKTHNTIVWLAFILGLACIGAGVVALVFNATGSTKLTFVGLGLDTSSVGVGCLVIGLLIAWLSFRSVLRNMRDMEQLRSTNKPRPKRRTK